jgi:hypothetical protein
MGNLSGRIPTMDLRQCPVGLLTSKSWRGWFRPRNDPAKRSAAWAEVSRIIQNLAHLGSSDIMKLELAADLLNT